MLTKEQKLKTQIQALADLLLKFTPRQLTHIHEYTDAACTDVHRNTDLIFPLGFTLHAFTQLPKGLQSPSILKWQRKLKQYLSEQQTELGTFNYWDRTSPHFTQFRLPDDVDDTACASAALVRAGEVINETVFFATLELEARLGGPYTTWYIGRAQDKEQRWQDVDPVVNAHFLYFAALYGVELPQTRDHLLQAITKQKTNSPYYLSELIFYVYFARYAHAAKDDAVKRALVASLPRYSARWLLADKLFYALTLLYCDQQLPSKLWKELISLANTGNLLPATTICYGFDIAKKVHSYVGSPAVSTALLLEVLCLQHAQQFPYVDPIVAATAKEYATLMEKIHTEAANHPHAKYLVKSIDWTKTYRAVSLPYLFAHSYRAKLTANQQNLLRSFATAAFWGWLEYTLLDDILDKQKPPTDYVILEVYRQLRIHHSQKLPLWWREEMSSSWQEINDYYLWEATQGRIDPESAIAHTIDLDNTYILKRMAPFVKGLQTLPKLLNIPEANIAHWQEFFSNLFLLDQLDDDSHDWEDDLARHILTSTVSLMLKLKSQHSKQEFRDIFWQYALPVVLQWADEAESTARLHLQKIHKTMLSTEIWEQMLEKSYAPFALAHQEKTAFTKYTQSQPSTKPKEERTQAKP